MNKIQLMTIAVAVGELQSFAAAARKLSMSPASVTRAIATLESSLGARLFIRTTRSISLTDIGIRYLDDVRKILGTIADADAAASDANVSPQGVLTITAPTIFGAAFVMPTVSDYLKLYPDMHISAYFMDQIMNISEENLDVAVRIGNLPDSNLKAVRIGTTRWVTCASLEYIKVHGCPENPSDLENHEVISSENGANRIEWKFLVDGVSVPIKLRPRFNVTNSAAMMDAIKRGVGIARVPSYQVNHLIADGSVQVVLQQFEERSMPIQVVHRENRYGSLKVRKFIDLLVDNLRGNIFLSS